jgi:DNA processing protein
MLDGDGPPQDPGAVGCPPADPRARHVLAALGSEGADLDELSLRTGLTGSTLAPILLAMELEGRLTQQHGVYHPCGSAPPTGAVPRRRRTG